MVFAQRKRPEMSRGSGGTDKEISMVEKKQNFRQLLERCNYSSSQNKLKSLYIKDNMIIKYSKLTSGLLILKFLLY
jgi:hypothetical protein